MVTLECKKYDLIVQKSAGYFKGKIQQNIYCLVYVMLTSFHVPRMTKSRCLKS